MEGGLAGCWEEADCQPVLPGGRIANLSHASLTFDYHGSDRFAPR